MVSLDCTFERHPHHEGYYAFMDSDSGTGQVMHFDMTWFNTDCTDLPLPFPSACAKCRFQTNNRNFTLKNTSENKGIFFTNA
jgi:hypothetical protein